MTHKQTASLATGKTNELEQYVLDVLRAREGGDKRRLVEALLALGELYLERSQPQHALPQFREAEALLKSLQPEDVLAKRCTTGRIGLALAMSGQPVQAESFLEIGFAYARETANRSAQADYLYALVGCALQLQHFERALWYGQQCLDLSQDLVEENSDGKAKARQAKALRILAAVHHKTGNNEESQRCSRAAGHIFTTLNMREELFLNLLERGQFDLQRNDSTGARRAFHRALHVGRELRRQEELLKILSHIGTLEMQTGHRGRAKKAWMEAYAIAEALGSKHEAASLCTQLGYVAQSMKHHRQAYLYHQHACSLFGELHSFEEMVHQINILGLLETQLGYIQTAKISYRLARNGYRGMRDTLAEVACFANQAEAFWQQRLESAFVLGIVRYALHLLKEREATRNKDSLEFEVQEHEKRRLSTLIKRIREAKEHDFESLWQESELHYLAAQGEEKEDNNRWQERRKNLEPTINQLGFLFHHRQRREDTAQTAITLIKEVGFNVAARPCYNQERLTFRQQHNRLAEALMVACGELIQQALHPGHSSIAFFQLMELYQEADDLLGQGITLFNEGIRCSLATPPDLPRAVGYLQCATLALGDAHADQLTLTQGLRQMEAWSDRMSAYDYRSARLQGMELYRQLSQASRQVTVQKIFLEHGAEQKPAVAARLSSFLHAIPLLLSTLLAEVGRDTPRRITLRAWRGSITLEGETTGKSLHREMFIALHSQVTYLFGVRFLEEVPNAKEVLNTFSPCKGIFVPLIHRTADGFQPGVHRLALPTLKETILFYLDNSYGRGVEIVNEDQEAVCFLRWPMHEPSDKQ